MRVYGITPSSLPREKFILKGVNNLTDTELVALVLGTGVKGHDVMRTSRKVVRLLSDCKDSVLLERLQEIPGVGRAQSMKVVASIELSKRLLKKSETEKKITCPEDVVEECWSLRGMRQENLYGIYLDAREFVVGKRLITRGSANFNVVHPREVFVPAIEFNAISIILVHNHPSGDASPSENDVSVTARIIQAGRILGIQVLDHLVVSKKRWTSMKESGVI